MSSVTPPTIEPVDVRQLLVPALGALVLLMTLLLIVALDQGALASLATDRLSGSGGVLHEFFHDARHLMGVPCH